MLTLEDVHATAARIEAEVPTPAELPAWAASRGVDPEALILTCASCTGAILPFPEELPEDAVAAAAPILRLFLLAFDLGASGRVPDDALPDPSNVLPSDPDAV